MHCACAHACIATHSHVHTCTTLVQSYACPAHTHQVCAHKHTTQVPVLHVPTCMSAYVACAEGTIHVCLTHVPHTTHMHCTCTVCMCPCDHVTSHVPPTYQVCTGKCTTHAYTSACECTLTLQILVSIHIATHITRAHTYTDYSVYTHKCNVCKHTWNPYICVTTRTTQVHSVRTHRCTLNHAEHACSQASTSKRASARACTRTQAPALPGPSRLLWRPACNCSQPWSLANRSCGASAATSD